MFNPLNWRPGAGLDKTEFKQNGRVRRKPLARKQAMKQLPRKPIQETAPEVWQLVLQSHPRAVASIALVCLVSVVLYLLPKEQWLPIEKIRLSGRFENLQTSQIERQLQPYLGHGFFTLDIEKMQDELARKPWVRNASVRRVWPNQVHVAIEEKQAVARWDEKHLLSAEGKIFEADVSLFEGLPEIHGYSGRTVALLQQFHELKQRFAKLELGLKALYEDNKGALTLEFDQGLNLSLGSEQTESKVNHFVAVYRQQIEPQLDRIKHIDFRYSNGFAIAWKASDTQRSAGSEKRGNKNV